MIYNNRFKSTITLIISFSKEMMMMMSVNGGRLLYLSLWCHLLLGGGKLLLQTRRD